MQTNCICTTLKTENMALTFKCLIFLGCMFVFQSCSAQISPPFVFHRESPYICFRKECRVKAVSHNMNQKRATGMGSIKSYASYSKKRLRKTVKPVIQVARKKQSESKARF
jgi:hypothetical protein